MATQITNYQCPACTGPLKFGERSGKLECEYCDSSFTVAEVEAFYADQEGKTAEAFDQEPLAPETDWDASGVSRDWGADAVRMRAYNCPSCGAELMCDDTTAATACPYCGNPTVVPGQFAGTLKPDVILPFKLDKNAAVAALKRHYQGKFLLPKAFTQDNHLQELQGVYVPFWLYDGKVEVDGKFVGIRRMVTRRGNTETTVAEYYRVTRRGTVEFSGVPVDGSEKMRDDYMDSLEPYDYSQLVPFSTAYLPGFLADRYDQSSEACAQRADQRCRNSAISAMRQDVLGYTQLTDTGSVARMNRGRVRYALLPVWVLHTKWQNQDYLFMMNGQTGKMVGDLPVSQKVFWGCTAALTAILTVLLRLLLG